MPRIQYLSQAGFYHYHDLGAPTKTLWLDARSRDNLQHESRRPTVGGWLLPLRPPIRAVVVNCDSARTARPMMAASTKDSDTVDLTLVESSDEDEVQFVRASRRDTQATGPKKTTPSTASKHSRQPPKQKSASALTPRHNLNDPPIDLRSDTASPGGSKPAAREKGANGNPLSHVNTTATKFTPSGAKPASSKHHQPGPFDDESDEFPELRFSPKLKEPPTRQSKELGGMRNGLKRAREPGSESGAASSPVKKAKLSDARVNGNASAGEISQSSKSDRTKANGSSVVPFYKSSSNVSQPSSDLDGPREGRTSVPSAVRRNGEHKSPSPFGSQRPNGTALPKRSNPFADLHASQEKRSAKQQTASQGEGSKATESPNAEVAKPPSQLPKPNGAGLHSSPSTLARDPAAIEKQKEAKARATGLEGRDSPASRSSVEGGEPSQKRDSSERTNGAARALQLLGRQSAIRKERQTREKPDGSSEDDPGYVSQTSRQGEEQAKTPGEGPTPSSKSPPPKARSTPGPGAHSPNGLVDESLTSENAELQSNDAPGKVVESTELTTDAPANVKPNHERDSRGQEEAVESEAAAQVSPLEKEVETAVRADEDKAPLEKPSDPFEAATEAAEANDQLQFEALRDLEQRQSRAETDSGFAVPQSAASAMKSTAAYVKLPLATKVEKVLGPYLEELAEDNEYWTSNALKRARLYEPPVNESQIHQEEPPTAFKRTPLKLDPWQKGDSPEGTWGFEQMNSGKPVKSQKVTLARQTLATNTQDVPSYAHYVSIRHNILAPNTQTLHCWPYFGDDFDTSQAENLKEQFYLDIEGREQKLLRLCQARKYEDYVDSALADLDISWSDVLRFLLEPTPSVGKNSDAIKALNNRNEFCKEEFDRQSKRWVATLSALPDSTPERLGRAAVLCENFQKLARFPLWHVARRSDLCKLPERIIDHQTATVASDEMTCRICLRFDCPYHGEIKERADGDEEEDESDTSSVSAVATDLVHPPKVNYRTRVAFPAPDPNFDNDEQAQTRPTKKDLRYWQAFENKPDARGPFYACSHPGIPCSDTDANCSCYLNDLPCEKFCGCSAECPRKFQGCSCSTQRVKAGKKGLCFEDDRCTCWQLGRECDPDLCGGCGVCEVVDPVNKHDDNYTRGRCQNASIQRAMPKCTLLGDSGVHGLGLYACEHIGTNDFVGEYKGEIITKEEAERRGAVYEHQKLSYLFSLNKDQEIDSTYFGNKIRFINHAAGYKSNLYPRIIMVNAVHRIALYASRPIKKGEELLFDYGPKFPNEQLGGSKSKKSAPHVRNANLVRTFYDVEEDEDELGNVRAKGVSSGVEGRKGRPPKARGGARPGAGRKPRKKHVEQPAPAVVEEEQQREQSPPEDEFTGQDAGSRLAAYNVFDDRASDQMDVDVGIEAGLGAAADDDDDEYQESEVGESEGSEEGESSEDEEEDDGPRRRKRGGPGGRSSWRTR